MKLSNVFLILFSEIVVYLVEYLYHVLGKIGIVCLFVVWCNDDTMCGMGVSLIVIGLVLEGRKR